MAVKVTGSVTFDRLNTSYEYSGYDELQLPPARALSAAPDLLVEITSSPPKNKEH